MAVSAPRRLLTVDEYYAMAKHGILKPDERVDLNADRIEVYRDPVRSRSRSIRLLGPGDNVSPIFAPDLVVDVSRVLGKGRADEG